MTTEEFLKEYARIAHGIQTGIKIKFSNEYTFSDPMIDALKHIRTGVDTAKADLGSIARLLIKKGIFTEQEYFEATLEGLQDELLSYQHEIQELFGPSVTLA